ncbi:MAG: hypothetical protein AVDCRST_MAG68-2097, partial [uncultured Gemmatimonadetes bacterium]
DLTQRHGLGSRRRRVPGSLIHGRLGGLSPGGCHRRGDDPRVGGTM